VAIRPLFLLSLPRTGSTLVQRILATHPEISTAAEPWILVPLLAARRPDLPLTANWDQTTAAGIERFSARLPGGAGTYRDSVRAFATDLYEQASEPGATYFLDKTPPYALFVDELVELFPDARFLVLWRNPLSVLASVVELFYDGRWLPGRQRLTLFDSLESLVDGYRQHADRMVAVRYDDIVQAESDAWQRIAAYLEIELDPRAFHEFDRVELVGTLGDRSGYRELSREPLTKWKATVRTPVRRAWARRYLRWIGAERLALMGYDLDTLLAELEATRVGTAGLAGDCVHEVEWAARRCARVVRRARRD
jgi:hypothetical protein